jgi:hypothetical protein
MKYKLRALLLGAGLCLFASQPAHATNVAVKLLLLVDSSGSISASEYNLQKTGYAQAFQNAAIQNIISNSPGGIAVAFAEWSSSGQQAIRVDWTHLTDATSANAFAASISSLTRAYSGGTAPQAALSWGVSSEAWSNAAGLTFTGAKNIIDISGDGSGESGTAGRTAALGVVDTINGLVIGGSTSVANYYTNNIVGGTDAKLYLAASFADFGKAVQEKIFVEIGGNVVPEPSSFLPLVSGVLAIWHFRRRKLGAKKS